MGSFSMLLMGAAVIAAVIAVGLKSRARKRAMREDEPDEKGPFLVPSFAAIDDTVRKTQCACGSSLTMVGEATVTRDDHELRAARCRCSSCEGTTTLLFDLRSLHH